MLVFVSSFKLSNLGIVPVGTGAAKARHRRLPRVQNAERAAQEADVAAIGLCRSVTCEDHHRLAAARTRNGASPSGVSPTFTLQG